MDASSVFGIALLLLLLSAVLFFLANKGGTINATSTELKRRKTSFSGKVSSLVAVACLVLVAASDNNLIVPVMFVASLGALVLYAACLMGDKLFRRHQSARWGSY